MPLADRDGPANAARGGKNNTRMLRAILTSLLLLALPRICLGSREYETIWEEVVVTTRSIEEAGVVRFRASSIQERKVTVTAFGRDHVLTEAQLKELRDFPLSSLSITYEQGHKEISGFTVHFKFLRGAYDSSRRWREEIFVISVPKSAKVTVSREPKLTLEPAGER